MFDYIVVGAGFSGAVMAERAASVRDGKVLVVEKRGHVGGNAYDRYNEQGVLIHQYGPHIFHTKLKHAWDYMSRFTDWRHYQHRVLGCVDGKQVPIPFNMKSLRELLSEKQASDLEQKLLRHFGYGIKTPILKLRESEDPELRWLADFIYEKVFLHYTVKQWGMTPEALDSSVTARVPVFISNDDRYFQDIYQGIPLHGYTRVFENMLNHPRIKILLNTDYKEVLEFDTETGDIRFMGQPFTGRLVYTGKIDELFGYEYGELPYRSLRFDFETLHQKCYQETGTINYPTEYDFTRITEFRHLTGQDHKYTTIAREYPQEYRRDISGKDIPYYPIPKSENRELYTRYEQKAKRFDRLTLLGRLAEYCYYDMDVCIANALNMFNDTNFHN